MYAIAAVDQNWGIGRDNALLFHISADMKRFRALTEGKTVLMGRKTLQSLPNGRGLPRRRQASRSKRRTSPSAGRKPQLHRLHPKQNRPSLRQPRNRSRQNRLSRHNHPRSRPPSRPLTSATGSTLPRAMPRVSVLRWTVKRCTAGTTPLMRMPAVSIWNGTYNPDSIAMRQMRTSPMCGSGMSPSPLAVI